MTDATTRNILLRDILFGRQGELLQDVHRRMRDGRTDRPNDVRDEIERSHANSVDDVDFALLQMKAETLHLIDEAIGRLNAGEYGCCFDCGGEISETRLRALPFAVRCKACEDSREQGQARTRRIAQQYAGLPLFSAAITS